MARLRLFEHIATLSPAEKRSFRKLVASPYFNTDEKLPLLADAIFALPASENPPERKALHAAAFPGQEYEYQAFNNQLSYLGQLLREFWKQEMLRQSEEESQNLLVRAARRQGQLPLLEEAGRRWFSQPEGTLTGTYAAYRAWQERDQLLLSSGLRGDDPALGQSLLELDHFYLLSLLSGLCEWYNRQNIVQSSRELPWLNQWLAYVEQRAPGFPLHSAQHLYYLVLQLLRSPESEDAYAELKRALGTADLPLSPEHAPTLFLYARNYCTRRINQGHPAFLGDLFFWYRSMLDRGYLFVQGYIPDADLKNLITLAVRLRAFDWGEQFLDQYAARISPEYQPDVLHYNRATLLYARGEFRAALRLLHGVDIPDMYYQLGVRVMRIKLYYELNQSDSMESALHALETSLRRNRLLSAYQRKMHLNLIRYVRRLHVLRSKSDYMPPAAFRKSAEKLRRQLRETHELSNAAWLMERLEELG